ncbi:hypothetical protein LZ32DRAFT_623402 [Colletotrichum eremochloae]|nr:hypothetical protein LZ32DRAFT_623402 [Colletotrichum eremochloae]
MAILDYEYDSNALPAEVKRAIDFLYEAADRKEAVDAWAGCFSKNGKLSKHSNSPVGTAALREFIANTWVGLATRVHDVRKVSVIGKSPLVLRIEGRSFYTLNNGKKQSGKWTAEQSYVEEDGMQKIHKYIINFDMDQL